MDLDKIALLTDQKAKVEQYKEYLERSVGCRNSQSVKDLVTHGRKVTIG